jgi:hypothetical protein
MSEPLLIGWAEVGKALHLHEKTANHRKRYFLDEALIFYRILRLKGEKRPHKRVCSFESIIKAHLIRNGRL